MRLLVLGGLGPYPERLLALRDRGHALWYACSHYLPAIRPSLDGIPAVDLRAPPSDWPADPDGPDGCAGLLGLIRRERIDAVYSLLNAWDGSNAVTAALLRRGCPVPVVRHYKEHYCAPSEDERDALERSAGVLLVNPLARDYFAACYRLPPRVACLDADPLPRRYLAGPVRPKYSAADGRPHLLVAGSAMTDGGRYDYRGHFRDLAARGAHVHLYGQFRSLDRRTGWLIEDEAVEAAYRALAAAPGVAPYLHLHAPVPPSRFVEEWSPYDAGLLHAPDPRDRFRTQNFPNRYSAYLAAGVPVALAAGELPALQEHLERLGAGVVYDPGAGVADLVRRLPAPGAAAGALAAREAVTFEALLPHMEVFLEACLAGTAARAGDRGRNGT
jgi:hypothetical protein